jgi:asparagine synthase (glutamine-hydrolysing)
LRGWAGDLLSEQSLSGDGYFDSTLVRRAWTEHSSGQRNWEQPLWNVLMFQSWLDEHRSSPVTSRHVPLHA